MGNDLDVSSRQSSFANSLSSLRRLADCKSTQDAFEKKGECGQTLKEVVHSRIVLGREDEETNPVGYPA